jgi:MarR family transcriptional regulator, organic hydroperoxide resistance regulator
LIGIFQKKRDNYAMTAPDVPADIKDTALETLKLFRIIFKSTNRHFHDVEKVAGVGGASLWALAEIAETKDLTVSGLSKAMSIHQSTASNLMDKLVTDGYVIRSRNQEDRRVVHLSLTQLGKDVLSKAPQPYRGVLPDALMRLNPNILNALNDHLSELILGMDGRFYDSAFEPLGKS